MEARDTMTAIDDLELHYRGDLRGKIEGQIVGPNRMGERFVIEQTGYDEATDRTTAYVRFLTINDLKGAIA